MSTYRLDKLLAPASVAVVGASPRKGSIGLKFLRNLEEYGFPGTVYPVNPRHPDIEGRACFPSLGDLPETPDLVIVAIPPAQVLAVIEEAGRTGAAAAIVVTVGLGHGPGSLADQVRIAARRYGLRLLGPNCIGVIAPRSKLNASFAARSPKAGDLALISQSGTVAAAVLEWAAHRQIGFSAILSLGDKVDVDFSDCMDFFAADPSTRAILLYIESISDARKFMSAARAASRTKPVVVIKAGRHAPGARAAVTHTGALAGEDAVHDAAFRRAGLLRVRDLDQLFAAAETLGLQKPFPGNRLAILTNGGGIGVLAVDRLIDLGGNLAEISDDTMKRLDAILPPTWSKSNPVDIAGDADGARFAASLDALLADSANDAVLILNVPMAMADVSDAARAIADVVKRDRAGGFRRKPVFAAWLREDASSHRIFEEARIPYYATEADAVRGFLQLVRYHEAQCELTQMPDSLPQDFLPDTAAARRIVETAIGQGRRWLDPVEVNALLGAYAIPVAPVTVATTPDEAVDAARPILRAGGAVAVKILSPDIRHKSDVRGVTLDLTTEEAVGMATSEILARAGRIRPGAAVRGVIVQPMVKRPKARELLAGLADDPVFGTIVVFGRGGTAVEVINDKALALPPLDLTLAKDLIALTRVSRILRAYRDVPAADERAIALVLVKLAQLAADLPEVREFDINPLLADREGIIAVDGRVTVSALAENERKGHPRFAVRPYPKEWERVLSLRDGRQVFVRPVRPEDEGAFLTFFRRVTHEDLRLRFFAPVRDFNHAFLARLTQLDYSRAIAFVAFDQRTGEMMGAVHLHADANHETGEYAILLRSDLKGLGLGWTLMRLMIEWAKAEGLKSIEGQVLRENTTMLDMCRDLGFAVRNDPDDSSLRIVSLPIESISEANLLPS